MPQFNDLTQSEQERIIDLLRIVRPMTAELYRFAQKNRVAVQMWFSNPEGSASTLADIVNGLDNGAMLPNNTGLAGAEAVDKTTLATVMGYLQTVAGHDSAAHLNNMLPFAGGSNFINNQ